MKHGLLDQKEASQVRLKIGDGSGGIRRVYMWMVAQNNRPEGFVEFDPLTARDLAHELMAFANTVEKDPLGERDNNSEGQS